MARKVPRASNFSRLFKEAIQIILSTNLKAVSIAIDQSLCVFVTFTKMNCEKICTFAPRSRNSNDNCSIRLTKVSGQGARACGFGNEIVICFKHLQERKRNDIQMCCYPLKQITNCSGPKVPCPARFFNVFDIIGRERGTHICSKHLTTADCSSEINNHENYVGPSPRKKVSLLSV